MALVVAHRGGPGLGTQENTLEAFLRAAEQGVPMAELDVRRLRDGTMVVYHDGDVEGVPLSLLSYAELHARTSERGLRPPTLEEVLVACRGRIRLDIELKEPGYEAEIVDLLERCGEPDSAVLKSFDRAAVDALLRIRSGLSVGLLVERTAPGFPSEELKGLDVAFIGPNKDVVDASFLSVARKAGVAVWVWTLHTEAELRHFHRLGVDALITDIPDVAMRIVSPNQI